MIRAKGIRQLRVSPELLTWQRGPLVSFARWGKMSDRRRRAGEAGPARPHLDPDSPARFNFRFGTLEPGSKACGTLNTGSASAFSFRHSAPSVQRARGRGGVARRPGRRKCRASGRPERVGRAG